MSFIATLDQLFDEKNLLDLLYGYYLQYVGIQGQYWDLETLEAVDAIPKEPVEKSYGGNIEGNIFIIIDIQTKEVLFQVESDSPKEVSYFEDKWIIECSNVIKIYAEDNHFSCVTINSYRDSNILYFRSNKIFIKNVKINTVIIYNWTGKKII